jgi:hypothetical protein
MLTKFFSILLLTCLLPDGSFSVAGAEGTLIFDSQHITLINTGSAPLDTEQLLFVRDDAGQPVRFEARSWNVPTLQPGDCVQVITANARARQPGTCRRLVRWLWTTRSDVYFWHESPARDRFRIVAGTTDLVTCFIPFGQCVFSLDKVPPVASLILRYDAQTFEIVNEAPTAAPLARLTFCETGPECASMLTWQTPSQLEPGACAALVTDSGSPCLVFRRVESAFWLKPFKVISPVTAHAALCPAALPGTLRVCVIAR